MLAAKVAPAVATGNTVVLKPSERNSLSTIYCGKLFKEAGFPPGVVNIVIGDGKTGAALASHPDVNKVFTPSHRQSNYIQIGFTGSVATGIKINIAAAKTLKRVTLELGGKNPSIVFPDCNMEVTVRECLFGFIAMSGQVCASSSRIYVHESIAPQFVEALKTAAEGSVSLFGDPNESSKMVGPIVDKHQFDRVAG